MIGAKVKKRALIAIFLTFGISTLAATILFPIIGHLFLSEDGNFLMKDRSEHIKGLLLGLFLAAFPLAQFFFSPIIGDYSDKKGRKGVLLLSVILEAFGYLLCALSIYLKTLPLLFLGRIITGVAAGNTSVCLATIVDVSTSDKEKIKYFGIGSAVIGLMFVLGPLIGGKFSSIFINQELVFAMPMWIGTLFALLNFFVLLIFLKETRDNLCPHPFDVLASFHNVQMAFKLSNVRDLFMIYFFFLFSWNMIYQFLPAFLVQDFHLLPNRIGDLGAYFGCVWIVGTLFSQKLVKHVTWIYQFVFFSLIGVSILAMILGFSVKLTTFVIFITFLVFLCGGLWPLFTAAISKSSEKSAQGKVLALSQSIQSFSMLLAPLIGGFFLHKNGAVPYLFTAISALIAAAILVKSGNKPFSFLKD